VRPVKIGELRDHLSRYLAAVRRGQKLLVMDRDTPVAEIGPVRTRRNAGNAERNELIRLGVILPAARPAARWRLARPVRTRGDVLAALQAERDAS